VTDLEKILEERRMPERCPMCRRKTTWAIVRVDRGSDAGDLPPGEPFAMTQCACGLAMEYFVPDDDVAYDDGEELDRVAERVQTEFLHDVNFAQLPLL